MATQWVVRCPLDHVILQLQHLHNCQVGPHGHTWEATFHAPQSNLCHSCALSHFFCLEAPPQTCETEPLTKFLQELFSSW